MQIEIADLYNNIAVVYLHLGTGSQPISASDQNLPLNL